MTRTLLGPDEAPIRIGRGLERLADLLALTLGPAGGVVVNARNGTGHPEYLTDSGTIARRVVQLPVPGEDAGAMLLRNMVCAMHERYGDGAATAAVLARALVRAGLKSVAGGANAMGLRRGIERGVAVACTALRAQAQPADRAETLVQLAAAVSGHADLSALLGELFEVLGAGAAVLIEEYYAPYFEREYLDGGRWTARPAGRHFLPEGQREVVLHNPLVMVADHSLESVDHVWPALECAMASMPRRPVLIIAPEVKGDALNALIVNHTRGVLNLAAVIPAANRAPMADELTDIALVTGASLLCAAAGRSAQRAGPSDLGGARRVVLAPQALTIVGGHGQVQNPVAIQRRIAELRAHMNRHHRADPAWENLRLRAGRLAGGVGILKIGAHTAVERALLKDATRKTIRVLDQAILTGVVPGGGVAYLNCIAPTLAERRKCADDDERRGVEVLARALEAPFLQIVRNDKRLHPPLALTLARERGADVGFDVRRGEFVDMRQAGVMDCPGVLQAALESAASTAVAVITAGALVFTGRRSADLKP